jgi:hypothetical protein
MHRHRLVRPRGCDTRKETPVTIWTIDVEYATHATLKLGARAAHHSALHSNAIDGTHRVIVLADSYTQAIAIACEMVCATHADAMPTATMVVL